MTNGRIGERELEVGDELGPYRLEAVLGEGGMGLVFRAVRAPDGQTVALKILKRDLCANDVYRQRFVHEARSASAVRHPHLVPILDASEHDGRPYLAVEFVEGRTLADRLASDGPLPLGDLLRLVDEIASALDALHEAEIVHRDVKPSNVLLRADDGAALLADFGLAKGRAYTLLTQAGQVLGTIDYLAPELIRGQPATPATDLYAFGCVVYQCTTGQPLFGGRSMLQVGLAHLAETPPTPTGPELDRSPALAGVLLEPLEKDPARRPASATAYARALRAAAGPQ
jgi:serine/threonine protein kinase